MMYSIGANGMQAVKKFDLTIGCTYYMGASSTPDVVHILVLIKLDQPGLE
jgi:hypothetical protein